MPHYTLVTRDGVSLGAFHLAGQNWREGDTIYRGDGHDLRVVDVLPTDDPEKFAILVVEEIGEAAAGENFGGIALPSTKERHPLRPDGDPDRRC